VYKRQIYQIAESNRIETIDSVARIESNRIGMLCYSQKIYEFFFISKWCDMVPKISAKLDRGHPLRGRRMQVGRVKIGDVRQISGYISKTVQDRRMVSIKVE